MNNTRLIGTLLIERRSFSPSSPPPGPLTTDRSNNSNSNSHSVSSTPSQACSRIASGKAGEFLEAMDQRKEQAMIQFADTEHAGGGSQPLGFTPFFFAIRPLDPEP